MAVRERAGPAFFPPKRAPPHPVLISVSDGEKGLWVGTIAHLASHARTSEATRVQARRRLGFAEKVRAQGLPGDYPTDIAYFTRFTTHELARFSLPSR